MRSRTGGGIASRIRKPFNSRIARAKEGRRLSVDEDLNAGVTAKADLSIYVYLDGRYVLEEIARRSRGAHDVLADIVHLSIDRIVELLLGGGDFDRWQLNRCAWAGRRC